MARPMRMEYFDESAVPCRFTRCWTSSAEAIFEFSLFSFWVNYWYGNSPKFTTSNNFQLIKAPNNDSFYWMNHLYGVTMGNQKIILRQEIILPRFIIFTLLFYEKMKLIWICEKLYLSASSDTQMADTVGDTVSSKPKFYYGPHVLDTCSRTVHRTWQNTKHYLTVEHRTEHKTKKFPEREQNWNTKKYCPFIPSPYTVYLRNLTNWVLKLSMRNESQIPLKTWVSWMKWIY